MKSPILLTIIAPAYNAEKTIGKLLASINNSDFANFKNIEAIIVDDCSSDNTREIVKKIALTLKFLVKLITQKKHAGPAAARNQGAEAAKGKYILFLDSDVEMSKNTLKNAFNLAKKTKVRAFTGIWNWQQKTDKFFPQFKAFRDWSYWLFEREKKSRYYLFSTRIAGIEKKLFLKIGKFDEKYSQLEDFDLTYRIEKIAEIKFCPNLKVHHEFQDFWPIAKKYFKRSAVWATLYLKRYEFDPVATSQKEAAKSIIAPLILFFLLVGIKFPALLIPSLILFLIYAYLERQFWLLMLQKKGLGFLLKAVPTSIVLYIIINLGALWGFLTTAVKIRTSFE